MDSILSLSEHSSGLTIYGKKHDCLQCMSFKLIIKTARE